MIVLQCPFQSVNGNIGNQNPERLTDWFYFKLKAMYILVRLQQCILNTSRYLFAPEVVQHWLY